MKRKSRIPATIGIWALIALVISLSGLPGRVPLPLPQILIAGLTVIFPLGLIVSAGLRQWVSARDLYGLTLFHELMSVERAGIGLRLLAELIAAGKLRPQIAVEAPWSEIGAIAQRLIDRDFTGKAVLYIE